MRDPTAVFATADGGRTWTESAPFTVTGGALIQVAFADATHGWLLADTGYDSSGHPLSWLYRTTDGRHWTPAPSAEPPGSYGMNNMCQKLGLVFRTATTGWLNVGCRSGEFLVRSSDGGGTWQPQSLPLATSCTTPGARCSVSGPQLSGGRAFVTIAPETTPPAPSLIASTDLGQVWQPIALPASGQYPQVSFFTRPMACLSRWAHRRRSARSSTRRTMTAGPGRPYRRAGTSPSSAPAWTSRTRATAWSGFRRGTRQEARLRRCTRRRTPTVPGRRSSPSSPADPHARAAPWRAATRHPAGRAPVRSDWPPATRSTSRRKPTAGRARTARPWRPGWPRRGPRARLPCQGERTAGAATRGRPK